MEEGFRLRPFTAFAVFAFAAVVVGGLVMTFVFADGKEERWLSALISLGVDVAAGVTCFAVVQKEERAPFPLFARKALWLSFITFFTCAFSFSIYAFIAPVHGFHPGISLSVLAPGAVISWRLLRCEKRG